MCVWSIFTLQLVLFKRKMFKFDHRLLKALLRIIIIKLFVIKKQKIKPIVFSFCDNHIFFFLPNNKIISPTILPFSHANK